MVALGGSPARRMFALVLASFLVASACSSDPEEASLEVATTGVPTATPAADEDPTSAPEATGDGGTVVAGGATTPAPSALPGDEPEAEPCRKRKVGGTGITDDEIVIGQIITDANQIPQQFAPAREGLQAYLKLVNANGGVCGRKLRLESRNDGMNPATHRADFQELAGEVFAFVANESLLDNLDYEQDPPFSPVFTDDGEPVPDVGGMAFAYGRSQSPWHAGVVGSVSPVLVGGAQYRFFQDEAKRSGTPCRKAGVIHLVEPTGASEDQARLGQVSLERNWGAGLGAGNTQLYSANLVDPVPAYEVLVDRMVADGMNCAFAYTDLQSSINMVLAMRNRGVWPPSACDRGDACFRVVYIPLSAHDPKFIADAGPAAVGVSTFVPHAPLNERGDPGMQTYIDALRAVPDAEPSTFSLFGFASGQMFVEALAGCREAPTRDCLVKGMRSMEDFRAGGLLGGTTPFRTTRASFEGYGTYDWKWIFNSTIALRVADRGGKRAFYRLNPDEGFLHDTLKVARGTPVQD